MGKPHVLVFPIPLQGHLNPMMMLAKSLNSSGIRVTFLLTERTLSLLRKNNSRLSNIHPNSCKHTHISNHCYGGSSGIPDVEKNDELHPPVPNVDCRHDRRDNGQSDSNETVDHHSTSNNHSMHSERTHNDSHQEDCEDGCLDACNPHNATAIQFETLPDSAFPHDESLPISTLALPFLNSMSLIRRKVEEILVGFQQKGCPVTSIISDSFVPWTQDVANKFSIPRIEFWSSSVTVYSMGYHIPHLINEGYLPVQPGTDHEICIDIIPGLAPFRLVDFFYTHPISSPVFDLISKAFSRAKEAQHVLINSFYDLEKNIIAALRREGVLIQPIGPLVPLGTHSSDAILLRRGEESVRVMRMSLYADDEDCLAWLDTQIEDSVIYVSFGSMVDISEEEMKELILGLEGSQQPYLLVVRSDMASGEHTEISGRGRICSWAPQIQVLGHPAVSGFLTHCGWNSIMEGMCMGVPMIGCPRESEQHTNLKCLRDEWKVAIGLDAHHHLCRGEIYHCEESPTNRVKIKRELVERAVRALMQEEIGVSLRERMRALQHSALRAARMTSSALQCLVEDIHT